MKKRLWLLSILAAIILCSFIVESYGLFETEGSAEGVFSIGKWVIEVNDVNITQTRTITLDDFLYTGNQHIESGYFAPGGTATLEIIIDASGSDVALDYDIEFDTTSLTNHPNINLTITNTSTNQTVSGNAISGLMYLNDNRIISLELTLAWVNNSSYDENDSELIDAPFSLTMTMDFSQLIET